MDSGCVQTEASSSATWNLGGTLSRGAWISPGLPSWPQAAIWSSPLLSRRNTTHPASPSLLRNSIIFSSLVALKFDPQCGLNDIRLILQGMPWTRLINLLASSALQNRRSHTLSNEQQRLFARADRKFIKQMMLSVELTYYGQSTN